MRKTLLSLMAFIGLATINASETLYFTDIITVTINGISSEPQETTIIVEELDDETVNLQLNNFILSNDGDDMYVGNIYLPNVTLTQEDGYKGIYISQTINISEGDLEGVYFWLGPHLGDVPIVFSGKMTDEKFYCTIDIDMMALEQIIYVVFGTDDFSTAVSSVKTSTEQLVNVYNLAGVCVKKNVATDSALEGLSRGIYIVGNKKVIKK